MPVTVKSMKCTAVEIQKELSSVPVENCMQTRSI